MLQKSVSSGTTFYTSSFCRPSVRNGLTRLTHTLSQGNGSTENLTSPGVGRTGKRLTRSTEQQTSRERPIRSSSSSNRPRLSPKTKHPLRGFRADPYKTSEHVKGLLSEGKFEDAVKLVMDLPKAALDTPVWNKLLHSAMEEGRFQVAYSLYIEMKRRGFIPTLETYTTMLHGWGNIPANDWPRYTKQLEHCNAVYQSYREYAKDCKRHGLDTAISIAPIPHYLRILNKTGQYQKMYDVFYSLDAEGPLAPNCSVYGTFFWGLFHRRSTEKLGNLTIDEQNASDAKLLWRQMEKDMEKRGFKLIPHAVVPMLRILARGRPSDHQLAIEIIRDYYGLASPGETPPPPKARLSTDVFQSILETCNKLRKFRLCAYYAKQVIASRIIVLDQFHMIQVLLAYHSLAAMSPGDESHKAVELIKHILIESALDQSGSSNLRPTKGAYAVALSICWRCEDWLSACDVFRLMTDYDPSHFSDKLAMIGRAAARAERTKGSAMNLDPTSAAFLARTAIVTKNNAIMRQCLRMLEVFDWKEWYTIKHSDPGYHPYYQNALASSLIKMVDTVVDGATSPEKDLWLQMKNESREVVKRPLPPHIPELEQTMSLKGSFSNHRMQQAVDFDMAVRAS